MNDVNEKKDPITNDYIKENFIEKDSAGNKRGKLFYSFLAISMIPLVVYGIIVILFSGTFFRKSMHDQVSAELQNVAGLAGILLDTAYPGDYALADDGTPSLYKGDANLTDDYSLVDTIKERTGMDVTLFYRDTRILTTIKSWDGERIVGTPAPEQVFADVAEEGEARFYDDVIIKDTPYFAYYTPLYDKGGEIIGILFVGKPAAEVSRQVNRALLPIVVVGLLTLAVVCTLSICYAGTFLKALYGLKAFFSHVATGNLTVELDPVVLRRRDELTALGHSALAMQYSLRSLVERDSLTDLYNRRSGGHHLDNTMEKARSSNTPFTLAIGDIDFFKKVNDTYGHQCGDMVLKKVARLLRRHMKDRGYAIRWGGEEFMLVYENSRLDEAYAALESLLDEVRGSCVQSGGNRIYITMTFGMVCDPSRELKDLLHEADALCYYGKENGKNQIVTSRGAG